MNVLVIDVGGSHVKMLATGQDKPQRFDSGPHLTPEELVARVKELTADWKSDVISLGFPGVADAEGPAEEPGNLADGWVGFDFEKAFGQPVRVMNDAAMQALGGYDGRRMLFLGLGTGLGTALIADRVVVPLELGCLPFGDGETMGERLGKKGYHKHGRDVWRQSVNEVVPVLMRATAADYVLIGGGRAKEVEPLPENARRGGNEDAFTGGFRLWEETVEHHDCPPSNVWRVIR